MTIQTLALIDLSALGGPLLAMVIFATVGILLMVLGFKVFDWITPKIDIQKELAERNNIAVGIVIGSVIIGVALVVAAAMT
jgi:putative membrane protein